MLTGSRIPSTAALTTGGLLLFIGWALPIVFFPGPPASLPVVRAVMLCAGALLFTLGCCLYARGTGYPIWMGLFGLTGIGLLMLMLLPDRFPEEDDA